jgi:hypothetical protein
MIQNWKRWSFLNIFFRHPHVWSSHWWLGDRQSVNSISPWTAREKNTWNNGDAKVNDILLQGAPPVCKPHSVSLRIDISWYFRYFYHKPQPSHKPTLGHVSKVLRSVEIRMNFPWTFGAANGVRLSQLGQLGDLQPQPLDVPRRLRSQGSSKHQFWKRVARSYSPSAGVRCYSPC